MNTRTAQPYHRDSDSCGQLFQPCYGLSALATQSPCQEDPFLSSWLCLREICPRALPLSSI